MHQEIAGVTFRCGTAKTEAQKTYLNVIKLQTRCEEWI